MFGGAVDFSGAKPNPASLGSIGPITSRSSSSASAATLSKGEIETVAQSMASSLGFYVDSVIQPAPGLRSATALVVAKEIGC